MGLLVLHLLLLLEIWFSHYVKSPFQKQCFCRCSSELAEFPISFSHGRSMCYSNRLGDISISIPRCYQDVYMNSFSLCKARLSSSSPAVCFPLTEDLNKFKSKVNRHLLFLGFFQMFFAKASDLYLFLFLVTPCLVVVGQGCVELIAIKKYKTK